MKTYPAGFDPPLVLSLTRPWAWSMIFGLKRIENRGWAPRPHRLKPGERFLVHSAKSIDTEAVPTIKRLHRVGAPSRFWEEGIIGSLVFRDVFTFSNEKERERVRSMGQEDWFFGPLGWLCNDPKPLVEAVPCRGALGLWPLPPALYEKVLPCL